MYEPVHPSAPSVIGTHLLQAMSSCYKGAAYEAGSKMAIFHLPLLAF